MVKDYAKKRKKKKTRLKKIEEKKAIKQAAVYIFFTIALIFVLIFAGIPTVIKLAVLLGNWRASSQPIEKREQLAPQAPTLQPLAEATDSATITVSGFSEKGTLVKIILNGKTVKEVIADNNGEFKARSLTLTEGENTIKAKAINKENSESDYSNSISIVFDDMPPELELLSPESGQEFFDQDRQINISGKTEKEAQMKINDRMAVVDQYGNFSHPYELKEGENKLKIVAIDTAGNETIKEITVTYAP
jgi:hypothetical protein